MSALLNWLRTLDSGVRTILLVMALVFAYMIMQDFRTETKLDDYIEKYEEFREGAKATHKEMTRLQQEASAIQKQADSVRNLNVALEENITRLKASLPSNASIKALRDSAAKLKLTEDSTRMAREVIPLQESIISQLTLKTEIQDSIIADQDTTIINLKVTDSLRVAAIRRLEAAVDTGKITIINIPLPPQNPDKWFFGLLNKPSRTTVGIVSAGVSAVATFFVIK